MAPVGMESKARRLLARDGGVVERPLVPGSPDGPDGPESADTVDIAYVRTGPRGRVPVVILPGGPGVASVVPYEKVRRMAADRGLDVIMVEHRGVGLSARLRDGSRMPAEAVTIEASADDVAAVLAHLGVERAVVTGTSYGTYLAQAVAVRHPEVVEALVLDSPILSVVEDLAMNRAFRRSLLWEGSTAETAPVAALIQQVAAAGEPPGALSHVVQVVYEFAGPDVLARLLRARLAGKLRPVWRTISRLGGNEIDGEGIPYYMEPRLVAGIAFAELGYGLPPDGGPLDPQHIFENAPASTPAFTREPLDLIAEAARYPWPVVVMSGDRDLRTPRPVAERLVSIAPRGVLVPLTAMGHSALDTHQLALIEVALATAEGRADHLAPEPAALNALPRKGASRHVGTALTWLVRATTRSA